MKNLTLIVCLIFAAVGLVWVGWRAGHRNGVLAAEVLKMQMFNNAFIETTSSEAVIELLDSGAIDDAKPMLRSHQESHILMLDNVIDSPDISPIDMNHLHELNTSMRSQSGSLRGQMNRAVGRVARHRLEYPWTYKGKLAMNDPAVEAKLQSILKQAGESPEMKSEALK